MNKRKFQILITSLLLLLLFVFPSASFEGAKKGLLLWFQVVLPTLLPFLIVSNLIVRLNITHSFSVLLYPLLKKIMPISPEGCYPVTIGLLSGYPMGAKACADMTVHKKISAAEGQFLLAFCNNASPMFLLNYVLLQSLQVQSGLPIFMSLLIGSSFLCGYIYLFFHKAEFFTDKKLSALSVSKKSSATTYKPYKKEASSACSDSEASSSSALCTKPTYFQILDLSIMNSFEIITKIGGYIILFSILANLITEFLPLSEAPKAALIGIIEITTGIQYIKASSLSYQVKILLSMALSAFGGLSSVAQTGSVLIGSPLKLTVYVRYKLLNSFICLVLTGLYLSVL